MMSHSRPHFVFLLFLTLFHAFSLCARLVIPAFILHFPYFSAVSRSVRTSYVGTQFCILHSCILHFLSPFHPAEHLADALGEEPRPVQGLGEGVAVAPHLHQQGAGGELLVVTAAAQGDGPGQAHVVGDELLLESDSQGQVVGVVNAKIMTSNSNDVEGIGFAIPIETALTVANDLIEYGYVTNRPTLGVSVQSLSQQEALLYRMEPGVTVVEVTPGGGAEKAGVQVGDKIVAFNGVEVETFSELNYEKDKCKPGDTVTLTVEREGSRLDLQVELGSSSGS